ncbi:MAG: glycosyltransferase family A protein [Bacteroidetes bacterium]|nr:glycosyltransferase family A protein [Bacteroidota bacterium]
MTNYAPVIIPTLNRHVHFKRCVESLSACVHSDKTDLFIFLDYPLKDIHKEGYEIIKASLPHIKGFKTINIIEREKNFGVVDNFFESLKYVFKRYDRLIFTEDDNVFAPTFLDFVNKGLDIYKDRNDIFAVSGYNNPFPIPDWYKHEAYLRLGFVAWGVGLWREKWEKVDWLLDSYNEMLSNPRNYKTIKKHYQRYLPQLLKIKNTGVFTADGFLFLYLLHNKMYSIYPAKSRVRNTGHDGTGEHCSNDNTTYMNQPVYEKLEELYFPLNLQPDKKLMKYVLKQIQLPLMEKIKLMIPSIIRVTLKKYLKK